MTSKVVIVILILLFLFIAFQVVQTRKFIKIGIVLANEADADRYEQIGTGIKILIIGDSTIVGTGASGALNSLPGLVGKTFPIQC